MRPVYPQVRTSADVLQSTIRLETLIPFLQQQKAEACAIVNSKLYGLLPFWHQVKQAGIHPVVGLEVFVQWHDDLILPVILYAKNNEGYQSLIKISSAIAIRKDEQLPYSWLESYGQHCIAVLPVLKDEKRWLSGQAEGVWQRFKQLFHEDLYVGISRKGQALPEEDLALVLAAQHECNILALHESTFLMPDDHFAYEVARSIESGIKIGESLHGQKTKHQFMLTAQQWTQWFGDHPEWLEQARKVLLSCQVTLEQGQVYMPKFPVAENETAESVLYTHVWEGLKERLHVVELPTVYEERMRYELSVITQMGYADYFLIVEDFMRYAREQGILTGPGRGSSASSLVAYSLRITQVDPLQYDLLFERFLNPQRISLPDIDIDFVDTKRQQVIDYVAQKYGKQYVAQIITFGTLSAKAVARDVARMFNFDMPTLEVISKMLPNKAGTTLQSAYQESEQLRDWIAKEAIREKWFATALHLEGLPRNASTHAAGVVLSPVPLVNVVPIQDGHEDVYLTQWPMQEVEKAGLLKMDFLGLRNLTILEQILRSIAFTDKVSLDLQAIPMTDEKTFQLLATGDTTGIFQLESEGMRGALREIKPTSFLDIVAVNALYRPGPMDFIPVYAKRKHGQEPVDMAHPVLEPILRETYGVIVYQEQILRIANQFAGFTIGEADILRRAVSKKNREVLEQQRQHFVAGATKQGHEGDVAEQIYELIVRFADYGFPKSHAVAYSIISYQLAYLKVHYPRHFYAALLTNATGNHEKIAQLLMEIKQRGIPILPPSIHDSKRIFTVEKEAIRYSLSAIKGVSQPFLESLMAKRKERRQPYKDLFDLAQSLGASTQNKKAIEPLIKAGALDDFAKDRAVLLATVDAAFTDYADMFLGFGKPKYTEAEPLSEKQKLQFEKDVLGCYLSEHPITKIRQQVGQVNATMLTIRTMPANSYIKCLGIITEVKTLRTKKGEMMAFVTMEDEFGDVSLTLFPKEYKTVADRLQLEAIVFIDGFLEWRFNKPQLKVKNIYIQ